MRIGGSYRTFFPVKCIRRCTSTEFAMAPFYLTWFGPFLCRWGKHLSSRDDGIRMEIDPITLKNESGIQCLLNDSFGELATHSNQF